MSVPNVQQVARDRSGGNTKIELRVSALEGRVSAMETQVEKAVENTQQILHVLNGARGTVAFFKKHGPRIVAFGTGIATAAGFGNPEVMRFISGFFA